jgi:hypothetical protein
MSISESKAGESTTTVNAAPIRNNFGHESSIDSEQSQRSHAAGKTASAQNDPKERLDPKDGLAAAFSQCGVKLHTRQKFQLSFRATAVSQCLSTSNDSQTDSDCGRLGFARLQKHRELHSGIAPFGVDQTHMHQQLAHRSHWQQEHRNPIDPEQHQHTPVKPARKPAVFATAPLAGPQSPSATFRKLVEGEGSFEGEASKGSPAGSGKLRTSTETRANALSSEGVAVLPASPTQRLAGAVEAGAVVVVRRVAHARAGDSPSPGARRTVRRISPEWVHTVKIEPVHAAGSSLDPVYFDLPARHQPRGGSPSTTDTETQRHTV